MSRALAQRRFLHVFDVSRMEHIFRCLDSGWSVMVRDLYGDTVRRSEAQVIASTEILKLKFRNAIRRVQQEQQ